jgi:uncharacterized protein (DUF1778 family)
MLLSSERMSENKDNLLLQLLKNPDETNKLLKKILKELRILNS